MCHGVIAPAFPDGQCTISTLQRTFFSRFLYCPSIQIVGHLVLTKRMTDGHGCDGLYSCIWFQKGRWRREDVVPVSNVEGFRHPRDIVIVQMGESCTTSYREELDQKLEHDSWIAHVVDNNIMAPWIQTVMRNGTTDPLACVQELAM